MVVMIIGWQKQCVVRVGVTLGLLILAALFLLSVPGRTTSTLLAQEGEPRSSQPAQVSDYLQAQLRTTPGPVSLLVILRDQVEPTAVLARANLRRGSRQAKAALLYAELTATAQRAQAPLRAWLDTQGIPYRAFYLVNMLEIKGDAQVVEAVQRRPEVARLIANPLIDQGLHTLPQAPHFRVLGADAAQATAALPYGLDFTHAPDVWALGYTGQGIVVASQDTGVEWDHPALKAAYRGLITDTTTTTITHVYNWYDAWGTAGRPNRCANDAQVPCDDDGHGTHTVGTMVGDATVISGTVLGMAPDAQWIGCRNMKNGVGTPASYTACFEFFLAPYPQGGDPSTDGHPELAPHIINNSWGCPPSEGCDADSLRQVVETVRAAGQMVVASAGNNGVFGCGSVQDPIAIYDATFSIGAHSSTGAIASFSSRGGVTVDGSGRMKPDLSAPGVNVYSTDVNSGFQSLSGTSMASPHVAGATALLWSAVPALVGEIDMTEQVLLKSATPVPFNQCGEGGTPITPNNTYGYGRLDILAAVQMARQPATVTVRVTDGQDTVMPNVSVTLIDNVTGYAYQAETSFDGIARLPQLYPGSYRLILDNSAAIPESFSVVANEQKQVDAQPSDPTDSGEEPEPLQKLFLPLITS